jgi:hypothetical protein
MRHIPSVDPEELRTLCKQLEKHHGNGVLHYSTDVPLCVRYLEAWRYGITHVRLLPEFIQKVVFKYAATRPLEKSDFTQMIEEVIARQASSRVDLQNPTQPVIL